MKDPLQCCSAARFFPPALVCTVWKHSLALPRAICLCGRALEPLMLRLITSPLAPSVEPVRQTKAKQAEMYLLE